MKDLDRIIEEDLIGEVTEDAHEVIEDPPSDQVPEINPDQQPEVEPEVEEEDEIERQMREAREKIEALQREKERRSTTPEPATEEIIPEAEPEADLEPYQEIAEDPNEVDQREIHEEVPEEKFEDFENIHANAEDWGIDDPEVLTADIPPKMGEEIEDTEEVLKNEHHVETYDEPPTPTPEVYNEEHEDFRGIPSPTDLPYEDDSTEDVIITEEEPTNQDQPEDFQEIKNETNDEEEIRRRYQGNILKLISKYFKGSSGYLKF